MSVANELEQVKCDKNCTEEENSISALKFSGIKQEVIALEDENGNFEGFYDVNQWKIKTEEIDIKSETESLKESRKTYYNIDNHAKKGSTDKKIKRGTKTKSKPARVNFIDCLSSVKQNKLSNKNRPPKNLEVHNFHCTYCSFSANTKDSVRKHSLKHKSALKNGKYKCAECSFTTDHRISIKIHVTTHKPILEVPNYKCYQCDYVTRFKMSLKNHLKTHLDPEKLELLNIHKCTTCNYATREKGNLKRHIKKHKGKDDVRIFSCGKCNFETRYRENLKRHSYIHKPLSKKSRFYCDLCDFQTPHHERLISHRLCHQDSSRILLNCKHCHFQTFHSGNLMLHYKREHKKVAEKLFQVKCKLCAFQTTIEHNLRSHEDKYHKNKTFHCKYCSYRTVYRYNLKKHHLNHSCIEKTTEDLILKCQHCTFQTPGKLSMLSHNLAHAKSLKLMSCQFCSYQTLHGAGLQKHYFNKHHGWVSTNKQLVINIVPIVI